MNSCLKFQDILLTGQPVSTFQQWRGWQSRFSHCVKAETDRQVAITIAAQKRFEEETRQRQLQEIEATIGLLVGAIVVLFTLVKRRQIGRALHHGLITFLATCMRIGRARDRFINNAVAEAKERLPPQGE